MIKLGLIGYPLGHSLSPNIHKAALKACGLSGDYSLFSVHPDDLSELKDLLAHVRDGEITGLNVTIPHKQNVIPMLDALTPTAESIGAVNTISMQEGKLIGDNTDAPGFLADLKGLLGKRKEESGNRKSALVLGAGGSARAVVSALTQDGWNIAVTARRPEQALELANQFQTTDSRITSIELRSFNSPIPDLSLIVNTTPVGMFPDVDASPWSSDQPFPPNAAIYDLVYNPRETKLVKDARAADLPATTGLGMLIEQAALAFEIWTGCDVPRELLYTALEE
jgi:shikimate dehydrogenase